MKKNTRDEVLKKKRLFFTVVSLALTAATATACDSTSSTQENMPTPKSGVLSSKSESTTHTNSLSEHESKPSHYIVSGGATVQQPFSVNPEGEVWGSAGSDPDDTVHLSY
ncbi:hypothetical protein [Paenibacillus sp. FSL K6-1318]|uniref:hypothetical protein n=1 Tax=Paenibacillus sp. FSL K6-1318 TaxID=2975291 RepID=UPI0030EF5B0F